MGVIGSSDSLYEGCQWRDMRFMETGKAIIFNGFIAESTGLHATA
jgi:hypothetical protein